MQYRRREDHSLDAILTGRRVLDEYGLRLGTVTDVVFAPGAYEPDYLVVDPGPLRRSRFVPTDGACQTPDGDVIVPWDRDWFRLAPKASGWVRMSDFDRRRLRAHYAGKPSRLLGRPLA
jgi:sporulation protein YlmC with PRC-barrel domain